ncbi:hypothetical protein ACP3TJ_06290 [Desulforudis sp. 1088]
MKKTVSLLPADGECRYELGYELNMDFARLNKFVNKDEEVKDRNGVRKC